MGTRYGTRTSSKMTAFRCTVEHMWWYVYGILFSVLSMCGCVCLFVTAINTVWDIINNMVKSWDGFESGCIPMHCGAHAMIQHLWRSRMALLFAIRCCTRVIMHLIYLPYICLARGKWRTPKLFCVLIMSEVTMMLGGMLKCHHL